MQVILVKNVPKLGGVGDIKNVSEGYARNYLIPKGFAVFATARAKKRTEIEIRQMAENKARQKEEAIARKNMMETLVFETELKKGENKKVFGSVSKFDILKYLLEHDISVPKDSVELAKPIKNPGQYSVPVRIHPEVKAILRLNVT